MQESQWRKKGENLGFGEAALSGKEAVVGKTARHKIWIWGEVNEKAEGSWLKAHETEEIKWIKN